MRYARNNNSLGGFEGELAVKLLSRDVEVGTSSNGDPIQDQVNMRRVHILGYTVLTTKALVLLGFSIIYQ